MRRIKTRKSVYEGNVHYVLLRILAKLLTVDISRKLAKLSITPTIETWLSGLQAAPVLLYATPKDGATGSITLSLLQTIPSRNTLRLCLPLCFTDVAGTNEYLDILSPEDDVHQVAHNLPIQPLASTVQLQKIQMRDSIANQQIL